MCIEKQQYCTKCGDCNYAKEEKTFKGIHNQIYNFIQLAVGGKHHSIYLDFIMGYIGYEYKILSTEAGKDQLKQEIIKSLINNIPVLMSLKNTSENWCIITGYDQSCDMLYGYDGMLEYWKDINNDMMQIKDGYLDNKLFYWINWYDDCDNIVFVVGKSNPKYGLDTLLSQLKENIMKDIEICKSSILKIWEDVSDLDSDRLLKHFYDCTGIIYEQMDTRHKLFCTFMTSVYMLVSDDVKPKIIDIAVKFISVHKIE